MDGIVTSVPAYLQPSGLSAGIEPSVDSTAYELVLAAAAVQGTRGTLANPSQPLTGINGVYQRSFLDEFYNRIWFDPAAMLNFGQIAGSKTQEIPLWNAFLTYAGVTVSSVTKINLDNTVSWDDPVPTTYARLQYKDIPVTITGNGTPTLNGQLQLNLSNGAIALLSILGIRSLVFAWPHDWNKEFGETLEYLTKVYESKDGHLQANRHRAYPRRTWNFDAVIAVSKSDQALNARSRALFRNQLKAWHGASWLVPFRADASQLTSQLNVGSSSVSVDTTGKDYEPGESIIFWIDPFTYESLTINTVSSSSVTFTTNTTRAWPAGTFFAPGRQCTMQKQVAVSEITDTIERLSIEWRVSVPAITANRIGSWSATTYQGWPVFQRKPQFPDNGAGQTQSARLVVEADYETGIITERLPQPSSRDAFNFPVVLVGRTEIKAFLGWLDQQKGAFRLAWYPTFANDIELISMPTGSILRVWDASYSLLLSESTNRRDIQIQLPDGTIFLRRIIDASSNGDGTEDLTLDTALPVQYTPAQVKQICFLRLAQMSDRVKLNWRGSTNRGDLLVCTLQLTEDIYT